MRSHTRDAATGVSVGASRSKFMKADDSKKLQEAHVRVFHEEEHAGAERFQQYGFNSVPLPPDPQGGKAAEAILVYLGAHRSHPVILAVDDRRHRPKDGEAGQVQAYHFKGHSLKLTTAGYTYDAGSNKKPHVTTVGNAHVKVEDGKVTCWVKDTKLIVTDGKILFGGDDASIPVMIESGPSKLLFSTS